MVLRVLQVVMDNRIGGVQNRILSLGPELVKTGFKIHVCAPDNKGSFLEEAGKVGLIPHEVRYRKPPGSPREVVSYLSDFPAAAHRVRRLVENEYIDIVHLNGLLSVAPALGTWSAGVPILWHLIGSVYPKPLVKALMPVVRRLSTELVFVAKEMRSYYLVRDNEGVILPESVDTSYFLPRSINTEKKANALTTEHVKIGFLGNINEAKGLEFLLQAIPLTLSHAPNCLFLIGGNWVDGHEAYQDRLLQLIKTLGLEDVLTITGKVSLADRQDFYRQIDIFCLPSVAEGTPLVILEAMASGLPIVATDVGGVQSQVTSGVEGFVVPPRAPDLIALAILQLVSSPELRQTMGAHGRARVKRDFSLELCVERYKRLYSRMASSSKGSQT